MTNDAYLDSIGVLDKATRKRCLEAMSKYGDNHWWEPEVDSRIYAYYQIHEDLHRDGDPNQGRLGRGLMSLLGRFVHRYEQVTNKTALLQEVDRAWRWGIGCTSDTERQERENRGALTIIEYCRKKGIPVAIDDSVI
jgi:hypothetical protein